MPPSAQESEVTLAVLASKVDNLRDVVMPLQARIDTMTSGLEERLRIVEDKTSRLEERLGVWQAAQALYSTIASAIAAFLGTR